MTRKESYNRIDAIIAKYEIDDEYVTITSAKDYDALRMARKILEQQPCDDNTISKQAVIDLLNDAKKQGLKQITIPYLEGLVENLQPVTPQMGCDGCMYEKTGSNSKYPCSHCRRCYTDKYKAENEPQKSELQE